jgi:hypothetical protein
MPEMYRCDPISSVSREILIAVPDCFATEAGGSSAILDPELWINVFQVFAHGRGADSEDHADFGVCFSSGEPAEHLALTQSQQAVAKMIASDR